jgi:branched-chain amino acid transport system permease protein
MTVGRFWSLAGVIVLVFPFVPGVPPFWVVLATYIGLYGLVVLGLVVLTGVGGLPSLGQALFVGIGAYTTGLLTTRFELSPWLTLPLSIVVTTVVGYFIALITLRLYGHFLAVATIAWNISFFYLVANLDVFGRYDGISNIPPIVIGRMSLTDPVSFYYLTLGVVALAVFGTENLLASRVGRAIRALKDGVIVAEAFGVDVPRTKRIAFVYAALLAGISGWLYAHMQRSVNPTPFDIETSIEYLLMLVVGGGTQVWSALAGAAILTILKELLQGVLPSLTGGQGNYETIVFGCVLIVLLQMFPGGLGGFVGRLRRRIRRRQSDAHIDVPHAAFASRRRAAPGTQIIRAERLRRSFGGLTAVKDVSLTVAAGEILSVIGPNGAGKSTTFNLMTGVVRPDAGRVVMESQDITGAAPERVAKLGLARTFQHVRLVAQMNVIDNVAIGAHLRGTSGAVRAALGLDGQEERRYSAEAERQLRRVGLSDQAFHAATSLPLGQQRIVEIARALCLDPQVLFLDEPAAGLRHLEKRQLAELLKSLRAEGMAILLVEHDMDFVMGLSDRVLVINFGARLAEGKPAEIARNPDVVEAYLGAPA